MAICQFCTVFGKEVDNEVIVGEKKRKTKHKFMSFGPPWRKDHIQNHMKTCHKEKWDTYNDLTPLEKASFFNNLQKIN